MFKKNNSSDFSNLYFVGIGGTAMASVAVAFKNIGYEIQGSDNSLYDPMKSFLINNNIEVYNDYSKNNIKDKSTLYVIGNAQSRGNVEVEEILSKKFRYISLSEILKKEVLLDNHNFVITGTHGKTTTSSILSWIFEFSGYNPNFVIGGIPNNFGKGARFTKSNISVIEGDEYDTSFFDKRSKFMHYLPEVVVINNLEFDHADIFDDLSSIKKSFHDMLKLVPNNGMVFINGDDDNCLDVVKDDDYYLCTKVGFSKGCDVLIRDVKYKENKAQFLLNEVKYTLGIGIDGEFNIRNAAMAICCAKYKGVSYDDICEALINFKGVKKRQEIRGVSAKGVTIIDDFAHHPTAISQVLLSLKNKYSTSRIWAIFEPKSYTSCRNIFQNQFEKSFSNADLVCIAKVAREDKIKESDRLNVKLLVKHLKKSNQFVFYGKDSKSIIDIISKKSITGDVVVVLSNGGFDDIHKKLLKSL